LWTTIEKSRRLLAFEGIVLQNRLLWLGIALAVLAATYLRFRFTHHAEVAWWTRWVGSRDAHAPTPARLGIAASTPVFIPQVRRTFGSAMHARQSLAMAWTSYRFDRSQKAG
jgi:hypothetical protein